ncbi:hypothetical protein GCM10025791_46210 [Halioxenophilus aromaticivorans]|uniref:Uncharacterized protein n=1 Tax=Halioxenophilus aromaticivorans TaxID=1306992 RepID=A0AAV3U9W9_9ALTE
MLRAANEFAGIVREFIDQFAVERKWVTNTSYCTLINANDTVTGANRLEAY